jgi:hypothetical protein
MSVIDPASTSSRPPETHNYYLSPSHMTLALVISVAVTVVPLLVLAWFSLDPDWMPKQPDFASSSRRRKGFFVALIFWAFFVLFMKLPFWIRIPFLLWTSYKFIRFFSGLGIRSFDRKPDFIISPEGVSGWSGRSFHLVPWVEISKLDVSVHERTYGGFKIGASHRSITFRGPETGPRRFFDTLPPRKIEITYLQGPFPEKPETILRMVRQYRPDLVKEDDLAELT